MTFMHTEFEKHCNKSLSTGPGVCSGPCMEWEEKHGGVRQCGVPAALRDHWCVVTPGYPVVGLHSLHTGLENENDWTDSNLKVC